MDPTSMKDWIRESYRIAVTKLRDQDEDIAPTNRIWKFIFRDWELDIDQALILFEYGEHYLGQFSDGGEPSDIDKSIESFTRAVTLFPYSHAARPVVLDRLGSAFARRFERFGDIEDIHRSIKYKTRAVKHTPESHMDFPGLLANLGGAYESRFWRLGELDDSEKAIHYLTRAVKLTPESNMDLPGRLNELGHSFHSRFQRLGGLDDINRAVEYKIRSIELAPDDHPRLPLWFCSLGDSLERRYRRLGQLDDLNKAIEHKYRAVALTGDGHKELSTRLNSLGISYESRFWRLGELDDINRAVESKARAVLLSPRGHPELAGWLSNLANSHRSRFQRLGELDDCNQAIEFAYRAVTISPKDHPGLPDMLNNLSLSYGDRFNRSGALSDCDSAIGYGTRAVAITPGNHPRLPARLSDLSNRFENKFQRLADINDINTALEYASRAVVLTAEGHANLPTLLSSLGAVYLSRFDRLNDLTDIDKSIEHKARAVELTSKGNPELPSRLDSLGISYFGRFHRLGELEDLNKAVEYEEQAIRLTPNDHPDLAQWLHNMGNSYGSRFHHLGRLEDLGRTIECASRSVALTSEGHAYLPFYLKNLGAARERRFKILGDLSDINEAVESKTRAVKLAPEGHAYLPSWLCSLGVAHEERFKRLDTLDDLNKAVDYKAQAVRLTPDTHANLPIWLFQLGSARVTQFHCLGNLSLIADAVECFQKASACSVGHPRFLLDAARSWGGYATKYSISDPVKAYRVALDILPRLIWFGSAVDKRYEDLRLVKGLAVEAAAAAIGLLRYEQALEWLEEGRSIVWNQMLQLRSPLDYIDSIDPMLAGRFRRVAYQVHSAGLESRIRDISPPDGLSLEQAAQQHRRQAEEYEKLVIEVRKLPGLENFLYPNDFAQLRHASNKGPVVTINCDKTRCDALAILPGSIMVTHVPLPNFSYDKAQGAYSKLNKSLGHFNLRERSKSEQRRPLPPDPLDEHDPLEELLAELWVDLAKPILVGLGYYKQAEGKIPRVTWCLTGVLSFLPLHAAGCYDQAGEKMSDYAISSYTPTLSTLLSFTSSSRLDNSGILAVGQGSTPGHNKLPGTTEELAYINCHAQSAVGYTRLEDCNATADAVLDAMERHEWVHLACHAHQNLSNPSESGFFLHNGLLSLSSIRKRQFKGKGLAFLSACQTATGDKDLPDESVHLASGMLMAGYPSVIATMWSVMDSDAPFVADKVYERLLRDGEMHCEEAAKALHHAVTELREKIGYKEFTRWVPYVHFGT
ncbi:unnamed protein product [Rhizoctonia solani]|uniref:CHAT domain-containing protein n=1 Tax=Rhizoctonia solani TaxID=456999 RepID=A0A8H3AT19_9AGAM|nr:unnamed protein product [Rhizoctonia solani]